MIFYYLVLPIVIFYILEVILTRLPSSLFMQGKAQTLQLMISIGLFAIMGHLSAPLLDFFFEHAILNCMMNFSFLNNIIIATLAITFIQYWFHRICHHSDTCWQYLHSMHHFPQTMTTAVALFSHPIDMFLVSILPFALTLFVLGIYPLALFYILLVTNIITFYLHTPIKTPQWFGPIIGRPEMHLIHHRQGFHSFNYGTILLWDLVFATYKNPKKVYAKVGFEQASTNNFFRLLFWRKAEIDERIDRHQWWKVVSK